MEVFRQFTFDSAHQLHHLPEGHKCARVHGHTYRLKVFAEGPINPKIGWIVDFAQVKAVTDTVLSHLDHHMLNDIPGLEQPTTENIAIWIWDHLKPLLPELSRLELWENANSGCVYSGS